MPTALAKPRQSDEFDEHFGAEAYRVGAPSYEQAEPAPETAKVRRAKRRAKQTHRPFRLTTAGVAVGVLLAQLLVLLGITAAAHRAARQAASLDKEIIAVRENIGQTSEHIALFASSAQLTQWATERGMRLAGQPDFDDTTSNAALPASALKPQSLASATPVAYGQATPAPAASPAAAPSVKPGDAARHHKVSPVTKDTPAKDAPIATDVPKAIDAPVAADTVETTSVAAAHETVRHKKSGVAKTTKKPASAKKARAGDTDEGADRTESREQTTSEVER